jgi:hypothetical protein
MEGNRGEPQAIVQEAPTVFCEKERCCMFMTFIEKLRQLFEKIIARCSCKSCSSSDEAKKKDDPSDYNAIYQE